MRRLLQKGGRGVCAHQILLDVEGGEAPLHGSDGGVEQLAMVLEDAFRLHEQRRGAVDRGLGQAPGVDDPEPAGGRLRLARGERQRLRRGHVVLEPDGHGAGPRRPPGGHDAHRRLGPRHDPHGQPPAEGSADGMLGIDPDGEEVRVRGDLRQRLRHAALRAVIRRALLGDGGPQHPSGVCERILLRRGVRLGRPHHVDHVDLGRPLDAPVDHPRERGPRRSAVIDPENDLLHGTLPCPARYAWPARAGGTKVPRARPDLRS